MTSEAAQLCVIDIMTPSPKTIDINSNLQDAIEIMKVLGVRHLPVLKKDILVGILSLTDILRLSFGESYFETRKGDLSLLDEVTVAQVMNINPQTVDQSDDIGSVIKKFIDVEFHAFPVMNHSELVGIVSSKDVMKYYMATPTE